MQCIKDTLGDSDIILKVEQKLQLMFDCQPSELLRIEKEINNSLLSVDGKINRWLKAFEAGSESESVLQRIKVLEVKKQELVEQLNNVRLRNQQSNITDLMGEIKSFIESFEKNFENAPIEEKKLLLQKMVSGIV